ncbi:hypothetical protein ACWEOI_32705 [Nocardia sp. NPDC004340]
MTDAERINWDHLKSRQPTDADRSALQTALVDRALAVKQHGWDDYRDTWTSTELADVAYLLQDTAVLEELDEPEGSVLTRYAGNLYGFNGARKDIAAGLVGTQEWFTAARKALAARER